MKKMMITLLAVGLCVGILLGQSTTANANIPPKLESGTPGGIDTPRRCVSCRLVEEPGAAPQVSRSESVSDLLLPDTMIGTDLQRISLRVLRIAIWARLI